MSRDAHPELPWRQAIGMRNIIAHDYGDLDYGIVYNVAAGEPFATFRAKVEDILESSPREE
jgi:uncharacterized protein with HEPN domain